MKISSSFQLQLSRRLIETQSAIARSLERLSTGRRLHRAADDVAGHSVSVRLESQWRGTLNLVQSLNHVSSTLQTAESAMSNLSDILQRMRELALQASNGLLSSPQRLALDTELKALFSEYERVVETTEFNGAKLLNGSQSEVSWMTSLQGDQMSIRLSDLRSAKLFTRQVGVGDFGPGEKQNLQSENYFLPGASSVVTGDFNGNGLIDYAVATRYITNGFATRRELQVFLNDGQGSHSFSQSISMEGAWDSTRLAVADVNNDGSLDILSSSGHVYLGNGQGAFSYSGTSPTGVLQGGVGDFDGDGLLDYATPGGNPGEVYINLGQGGGSFAGGSTLVTGGGQFVVNVIAADFNGSGILDLLAMDVGGNSYFFEGQGGGNFKTAVANVLPGGSQNIVSGDFNGDGIIDIVRYSGSQVGVFFGDGTGAFSPVITTDIGVTISALRSVDISGNGVMDLFVSSSATNRLYSLMNNGSGSFSIASSQALQAGQSLVAAVDLNGNGFGDALTLDAGNVGVLPFVQAYYQNIQEISAIDQIGVDTAQKARSLLDILDQAQDRLMSERLRMGSSLKRLEYQSSLQSRFGEATAEALSNVTDADIGIELAELTRLQILQQVQVAVLGQGSLQLQLVVRLLQGIFS